MFFDPEHLEPLPSAPDLLCDARRVACRARPRPHTMADDLAAEGGGDEQGLGPRRRAAEGGLPLDNLLRLLVAGGRPVRVRGADAQASNAAELITALKATGMLNR